MAEVSYDIESDCTSISFQLSPCPRSTAFTEAEMDAKPLDAGEALRKAGAEGAKVQHLRSLWEQRLNTALTETNGKPQVTATPPPRKLQYGGQRSKEEPKDSAPKHIGQSGKGGSLKGALRKLRRMEEQSLQMSEMLLEQLRPMKADCDSNAAPWWMSSPAKSDDFGIDSPGSICQDEPDSPTHVLLQEIARSSRTQFKVQRRMTRAFIHMLTADSCVADKENVDHGMLTSRSTTARASTTTCDKELSLSELPARASIGWGQLDETVSSSAPSTPGVTDLPITLGDCEQQATDEAGALRQDDPACTLPQSTAAPSEGEAVVAVGPMQDDLSAVASAEASIDVSGMVELEESCYGDDAIHLVGAPRPGEASLPLHATLLYRIEQDELNRQVPVLVPEGMTEMREVQFVYENREHRIVVPHGYSPGQEVCVLIPKRPFLERNRRVADYRGHHDWHDVQHIWSQATVAKIYQEIDLQSRPWASWPVRTESSDQDLRHQLGRVSQEHLELNTLDMQRKMEYYRFMQARGSQPLLSSVPEDVDNVWAFDGE
mmetsp:Transcript_17697/g.41113  ORF Transcript_17697/g.41113 Transcript_17697/m.41113 type:complete len:546 (+) Transcript_17697:46-1683(+)